MVYVKDETPIIGVNAIHHPNRQRFTRRHGLTSDRTDLLDRLSDARLRILGERLLYTEAPEVMPTHDRSHLQADLAKRLVADEGTVP